MGHSWQFALTAVFIEGVLFVLLSLFKVRELIANAIPTGMKSAIGWGIGLFIAFIGLQNCGIIIADKSTQVTLANFDKPSVVLSLIGLVICGLLVVRNVRGGLLWGILLTALIGIPMGVTHFGEIIGHESEIESRLVDSDCTMEALKSDNKSIIDGFQDVGEQIVLIDSDYKQTIEKLLD
jgi:AGZA family xanthine/uracil permease-like MFS transporter